MATTSRRTSVAVCVPTRKRPAALSRLLESLTQLEPAEADLAVIVVDNDPEGSARASVQAYLHRFARATYEIEPEAGIPAARNRLVALALEHAADFVAFVDDDEWVEPGWLRHLLRTARAFRADAVLGPVVPVYDDVVPQWLRDRGFYERPRAPTGSPVVQARTGNALVSAHLLADTGEPFPRSLAVGEDTYFFERARRRGATMVWCDEALAYEAVPPERARVGWLLARAFRQGSTYSRCQRLLGQTRRQRAVRVATCLGRLVQGLAVAVTTLPVSRVASLRAARRAAGALGGLAGALASGPSADESSGPSADEVPGRTRS